MNDLQDGIRELNCVPEEEIKWSPAAFLRLVGESAFGKLITFGDKSVEMHGTSIGEGLSVEIASNELKRFNRNESKRACLTKAGAAMIAFDFLELNLLLTC